MSNYSYPLHSSTLPNDASLSHTLSDINAPHLPYIHFDLNHGQGISFHPGSMYRENWRPFEHGLAPTNIKVLLKWPNGGTDGSTCIITVQRDMTVSQLARAVVDKLNNYYLDPRQNYKYSREERTHAISNLRILGLGLNAKKDYYEPDIRYSQVPPHDP